MLSPNSCKDVARPISGLQRDSGDPDLQDAEEVSEGPAGAGALRSPAWTETLSPGSSADLLLQACDEYFIAQMQSRAQVSLFPLAGTALLTALHLHPSPSPAAPKPGKSVPTFIRNQYEPTKRCEELICAELIRMNKVTTDFAMGISDKDLSEELQVRPSRACARRWARR
ncbi:Dynamin-1-Like Protein [Manis pentadactyla]|nr:Dynamin-1-Like Protein [Manis pentadactyla]